MPKVIKGGERATDRPKKLFVQCFGVEGTGKTSFALSFPPPLYVLNLDRNMDDLLEMLPSHYEIHYEEVMYDVDMNQSTAADVVLRAKKLMNEAIKNGEGTFFVDGIDLLWDYVKIAKLPKDADTPNQWGPANTEMESIFRRCEQAGIQVVFNTIASNVWTGATKESTKMKPDGFKHAKRFLNAQVYLFCPEDYGNPQERPSATPNGGGQTHSAFVTTSKLNEKLVGTVMVNPSYMMLYRATFGMLPPNHDLLWKPGTKGGAKSEGAA